jgi:hypothetical protein
MSSNTGWGDLASSPSELVILRAVVAQHIADGLTSGSPTAAALAQSLLTELDAAGLDIGTAVNAVTGGKAVNG